MSAGPNLLSHAYRATPDRPGAEQLWNERQAADYLGIAPKTLRQWRCQRSELPFVRLNGRMIRYRRSDLEEFVSRNVCLNTSNAGGVL